MVGKTSRAFNADTKAIQTFTCRSGTYVTHIIATRKTASDARVYNHVTRVSYTLARHIILLSECKTEAYTTKSIEQFCD